MRRGDWEDRVFGSIAAACVGDAMGAPTEQLSIGQIRARWGGRVETLLEPPPDAPFSAGRRAGEITDDASQMLALLAAYVEGKGELTPALVAQHLLRWSEDQRYGSMAGPSTQAALARLRAGADPATSGRQGWLVTDGASNGAAMRVAPCGLANPGDLERAVRDAVTSCLPTHGTQVAISGAAALAAGVAEALSPSSTLLSVVRAARYGAAEGERLGRAVGREVAAPSVLRRIDLAVELAVRAPGLDQAVAEIADLIGTGLQTSEAVPAAIGIFVAADGRPEQAIIGGANAGYDTDTVACMAGALAGAFSGGDAVPAGWVRQVELASALDLRALARAFVAAAGGRGRPLL